MTSTPTTPEAALDGAMREGSEWNELIVPADVLAYLRALGWDVVQGWQTISGMPPSRYAMVGRWCGGGSFRYWHQVLASWYVIEGKREWSYVERHRPSPFYNDEGNYAEPTHFHEIPPPPATGATP